MISNQYVTEGVYVEEVAPSNGTSKSPILFIHGGAHGSWTWEKFQPFFAEKGWRSLALNWFHHYRSDQLPMEVFLKRHLSDIVTEVEIVAKTLDETPIIVGHSMGGLVAQIYATKHPVKSLVLLAPCAPKSIGRAKVQVDFDLSKPWQAPPFPVAKQMFFSGLSDEQAQKYYDLLSPESPQVVKEIIEYQVDVDLSKIQVPSLLIVGDQDTLCPKEQCLKLAQAIGADTEVFEGWGHNIALNPDWEKAARTITDWLAEKE